MCPKDVSTYLTLMLSMKSLNVSMNKKIRISISVRSRVPVSSTEHGYGLKWSFLVKSVSWVSSERRFWVLFVEPESGKTTFLVVSVLSLQSKQNSYLWCNNEEGGDKVMLPIVIKPSCVTYGVFSDFKGTKRSSITHRRTYQYL